MSIINTLQQSQLPTQKLFELSLPIHSPSQIHHTLFFAMQNDQIFKFFQGNIIFTDSGSLSQISFHNPKASVSSQLRNKKILTFSFKLFGITHRTLDLYDFFRVTKAIFYSNIFYQFSGIFAKSCNSYFTNLVITELFEFKNITSQRSFSILNSSGQQLATLKLNHTRPQITGFFFSPISNHNIIVYATQNSGKPSCYHLLIEVSQKNKSKNEVPINNFEMILYSIIQIFNNILEKGKQYRRISIKYLRLN